jgi:hypothetical protein
MYNKLLLTNKEIILTYTYSFWICFENSEFTPIFETLSNTQYNPCEKKDTIIQLGNVLKYRFFQMFLYFYLLGKNGTVKFVIFHKES